MRATTLLRKIIGISLLHVLSVRCEGDDILAEVRPKWRKPRCGVCGKRRPQYDQQQPSRWRHLSSGCSRILLEYAPRRVSCPTCGVRREQVPWAGLKSRFTTPFEEMCAYLCRATDKTTVTAVLGIAWATVGRITERVVARKLDESRLEGLRRIGVDEFSYRRRHRYMTVIVDHDRRRVVWAAPGSQYETLRDFFRALGPERCAKIKTVTVDMNGGFKKAIAEALPHAEVVYDRFHVQRLVSNALDLVRKQQLREIRGTPEGKALFRSRFALLKNPWDLSPEERRKLKEIEKENAPLFRAYLLKESFAQALDFKQPWKAKRAITDWLSWASRSRLAPFVKVARTIRKHLGGILAYIQERFTNGIVEGMNTRLRMIARRAFGFHGPEPLIAMAFLCCGGIELDPPLPVPTRM